MAALILLEGAHFFPRIAEKAIEISVFFFRPFHMHHSCAIYELPHRLDLTQTSEHRG
jgi:hypothetical protein